MKPIAAIIIFIQLFLTSISMYAQEGWFSINHVADGNNMNSIYFINDSTGYTVSDEGYVFRTSDKGVNWVHTRLSLKSLNDVYFSHKAGDSTNNVGFIAGDSGKVFRTTDGKNWQVMETASTSKLMALWFVDADTGYAFGYNSTILKTTNSGESWTKLSMEVTGLKIVDGAFSTAGFGMCVTQDGVLIRTTNFGQSWQYMGYSDYVHFYSVSVIDTSTAYITGFDYDVPFALKSTDKGEEFQTLYNVPDNSKTYFMNADTAYLSGFAGCIAKSVDGGLNWIVTKTFTYKDLHDIYFYDEKYGYACGEDSTILRTTNGGATWDLTGSGHTLQLMNINFATEKTGYTVSNDGNLFKTTDAGNSWVLYNDKMPGVFPDGFKCVYFLNPDTGFIGAIGQILRTTDGGQTWENKDFGAQGIRFTPRIKFYNKNIGLISSWDKLLTTTNGGTDWNVIAAPSIHTWDACYADSGSIILVGDKKIFKSTDNGNSWQIKKEFNLGLLAISFLDNKTGYVVGSQGTLLRTSDGGENWDKIVTNTIETLWKITFTKELNCYIIGDRGIILFSNDFGLTWSTQKSNTIENLNDVFFLNGKTGYIAGNSGTILKTINGGIISDVKEKFTTPSSYCLYQNYPNPFNPNTTIEYYLPKSSDVVVKIYNSLGQEIKELVNCEQTQGRHKINFNGINLSSGIYFYRITANSLETGEVFVKSAKMLLLK